MQDYRNHKKIYPLHMFVFLPISLLLFILSLYKGLSNWNTNTEIALLWLILSLVFFLFLLFSGMVRLHYGMTIQNRLILLEVSYRYYLMTGKDFEKEVKLTDSQVFAIRFAGDEEFLDLIRLAQEENLDSESIKKRIKNWKADYRRI